jgi:DNA-binding MarR family transcriptional regulator
VERVAGSGDRREVVLTLTVRGRGIEKQVREIERKLFAPLADAIAATDLASVVRVLGVIVSGTESGDALERRRATA